MTIGSFQITDRVSSTTEGVALVDMRTAHRIIMQTYLRLEAAAYDLGACSEFREVIDDGPSWTDSPAFAPVDPRYVLVSVLRDFLADRLAYVITDERTVSFLSKVPADIHDEHDDIWRDVLPRWQMMDAIRRICPCYEHDADMQSALSSYMGGWQRDAFQSETITTVDNAVESLCENYCTYTVYDELSEMYYVSDGYAIAK